MTNPIAVIPDEQLSYQLVIKGKKRAELEREWAIIEHQRLPVLAEITGWFQGSHAESERKARVTKEYQAHLRKRGEIKEALTLARNEVDAVKLEIQLRINKSFTDRAEYKSGHLQT